MKDVAVEAGVTAATVSLVLKGNPAISSPTREKVLRAAERLRYRRNPYVSALMATRRKGKLPASSPVLAFATAWPTADGWRRQSESTRALFEGARARAAEKGCRLESFWLGENGVSAKRAMEVFYARNIPGALLAPFPKSLDSIPVDWKGTAVVALGFSLARPALHRVACDHFHSMMTAFRRCVQRGYGRIGLVLSEDENRRVDGRWLAGYLMEQKRSTGGDGPAPLLLEVWDQSVFTRWMRKERPDVILGASGPRLVAALERVGLKASDDVGVVSLGLDGPKDACAGIFQNPSLLAARAVDLLLEEVAAGRSGLPEFPNTLLVDGIWIPGATLRPPDREEKTALPEPSLPCVTRTRHVSMRDVAARAGVHPATVSLSLRDSPLLPETTKEKVRAAAAEVGYRQNSYLSILMRNRRAGVLPRERPLLGFVTTFPTRDGWRRESAMFPEYFLGARRRAEALGFRLKEFWLQDPARGEELSRDMADRGVQGLIFPPLPALGMKLELLWEKFCLVAIGFTLAQPQIHRVASDTFRSMRRAVLECHRLGYRRIGVAMTENVTVKVQNRWLAAYITQQRELEGLEYVEPLTPKDWQEEAVSEWMKRWRPDAIVAPSVFLPLDWLRGQGYTVPDDIGLVSLGCPESSSWLSGIYQRPDLLGARAIDVLVGLLERGEYGIPAQPNALLIDGIWNPGGSVRASELNGDRVAAVDSVDQAAEELA